MGTAVVVTACPSRLRLTGSSFGGLFVMATSSKRIILVDPLGEVLFSGESLVARGPDADVEACPETKRSAESGVFRAVDEHDESDQHDESDAEIATNKRGPRAA